MFAVLKGRRGLPTALFEIERETPKRYYGVIVDKLEQDRHLYLPGHTVVRNGQNYVEKYIVECLIPTDRGWYENKKALASMAKTLKTRFSDLDHRLNDVRNEIRDEQHAILDMTKAEITAILADYHI